MRWGVLIDLNKCVGCHACTIACQNENDLPLDMKWNRVFRKGPVGEYPNLKGYTIPLPCMHCQEAPCIDGCPTGASYRTKESVVLVNEDKCVGCKFCMVVCPYEARVYNEDKGVVEKCVLCVDRLAEGQPPRCVETCQLKARIYGDLDDPNSEINRYIEMYDAKPLYPELGTKPLVYYVFPEGMDNLLEKEAK